MRMVAASPPTRAGLTTIDVGGPLGQGGARGALGVDALVERDRNPHAFAQGGVAGQVPGGQRLLHVLDPERLEGRDPLGGGLDVPGAPGVDPQARLRAHGRAQGSQPVDELVGGALEPGPQLERIEPQLDRLRGRVCPGVRSSVGDGRADRDRGGFGRGRYACGHGRGPTGRDKRGQRAFDRCHGGPARLAFGRQLGPCRQPSAGQRRHDLADQPRQGGRGDSVATGLSAASPSPSLPASSATRSSHDRRCVNSPVASRSGAPKGNSNVDRLNPGETRQGGGTGGRHRSRRVSGRVCAPNHSRRRARPPLRVPSVHSRSPRLETARSTAPDPARRAYPRSAWQIDLSHELRMSGPDADTNTMTDDRAADEVWAGLSELLDDLEYHRNVHIDARLELAMQVEREAAAAGATDLQMRARLVQADMRLRTGQATAAAHLATEVNRWAREHGPLALLPGATWSCRPYSRA